MLILSKKRITLMLCMIFVSLYAFSFKIANNSTNLIEDSGRTVETVATPVSNKVIIVDAGHGTPDEGQKVVTELQKRELNLKIALKLQTLLGTKWTQQ